MSEKKSSQNRRNILKSIGIGSLAASASIPSTWHKPVVNTILIPAHAQTSHVCCEGVFCTLSFISTGIGGSAEVFSDCTINLSGISAAGAWSGSGLVSEDGTFSFDLTFAMGGPQPISGTVEPDCSRISGVFAFEAFSGSVTDGINSIGDCPIVIQPSDIRLKTNIELLQTSRQGHQLYQFEYTDKTDQNTYVGVMAQDILPSQPQAVVLGESGYYGVRYGLLGLKMVTLEQWQTEGPDSVELWH